MNLMDHVSGSLHLGGTVLLPVSELHAELHWEMLELRNNLWVGRAPGWVQCRTHELF